MSIFRIIKSKVGALIVRLRFSPLKYWEERARNYGELSVLNLGHKPEDLAGIKEFQKGILFPLLGQKLLGTERTLLDFGCGPGRFSADLAQLTNCNVTAVDPIDHLLQMAPKATGVVYKKITDGKIPAENEAFDIIWICLVLGGIVSKRALTKTIGELNRVAKKNTLLFLVENTADLKETLTWKYRSADDYIRLFKNYDLAHLKDYEDVGETISVFAGRLK